MENKKSFWEKVKVFVVTSLIPFIRQNTTVSVSKNEDNSYSVVVMLFDQQIVNEKV